MPAFQAGQKLTAAALASFAAPLAVIKPSDQSVTSSTVLVNDTALVTPNLVASATYLFWCYLNYEGGTGGSSDIKWQWAAPAGATLRYGLAHVGQANNVDVGNTYQASDIPTGRTQGAGVLSGAIMTGSLVMSTTAGSLQLKWAQNTSNATATIVHAQSTLALWRVT